MGSHADLTRRSLKGDNLDIHHVPQQNPAKQSIPGYDPKTAPSIAVPRDLHRDIPTVKGNYLGTPRDQLAKDIRDLRNYTDAPNSRLRELIDLVKQTYPDSFRKR